MRGAKYEGDSTPKSLTGRREDTGFTTYGSLQAQPGYTPYGGEQPQYQSAPPMTYQPGPSSSGLEGRPGASRMEPGSSSGVAIPPSGPLALGAPAMSTGGYSSQGFASQQASGGPSLYAPQLSVPESFSFQVPAQETVNMEAINTHETNTTLDNYSFSGLQPVPYTGDPPTPPQALSQLDLTYNPNPGTIPQSSIEAQPPGTITTVVPGTMAVGMASSFDAPQTGVVSFQSLPARGGQTFPVQGDVPNYPAFAPQSSTLPGRAPFQSSTLRSEGSAVQISGGIDALPSQGALPRSITTVPDSKVRSRTPSPRTAAARPFASGTWQPEVSASFSKSEGMPVGSRTFAPSSNMKSSSFSKSLDERPSERPYTGKVVKADGSVRDHQDYSEPKRTTFAPTPSSISSIKDEQKVLSEKDIGYSKLDKAKDDESEKENLISDIRERDATIARLLRDVREKRAIRMKDVEELSDRMDHLEARLLSKHLDVGMAFKPVSVPPDSESLKPVPVSTAQNKTVAPGGTVKGALIPQKLYM